MSMDSATRKKRLFWYFVIMAVYSVVSNFAHPATPTIIKNLNLHDYMFGVAFAGMSITNFLFSPFWGRISDQIGRNKVFLACGIGYGVGQAVFGMATTELGILFGRMISGFFIGGGSVVQLSYIMDYSDAEQRGKNFTLLAVIQSVSSAAGYLIGGYISEYSIPMMFVLQVVSLAATGIIFAVLCKDNEELKFSKKIIWKEAAKGSNPFGAFARVGKQMTKVLIILSCITLIASFANTAYDQCFNYYIKDQYFFSPSNNGVLRAGLGIVALVANMSVGMWIMKRTNLFKSLIVVLGAYGTFLIGLLFPQALAPFVVINIFLYSLNALYNPLIQATYAQGVPDQKQSGVFMGVFTSLKALGMVAGSLFAGFIYGFGPRLSFLYAMAGLFIACALAVWAYAARKKELGK